MRSSILLSKSGTDKYNTLFSLLESNLQLLNPIKLKPSLTSSNSKFLCKTLTGLSFANSERPISSKISNEIANIEYELGKMKRKSKLREIKLNKELSADNSELKTYVELRNILLNHLQNTSENIRSERELVLIKK